MATLADIARSLSVSKSTVSKALSGAPDISQSMRTAILEKAVELGYSPCCRKNSPKKLALFIENIAYQSSADFGYDMILGFRQAAEPLGYEISLIPTDLALQSLSHYDAYMLEHHYMGGLFLGASPSDPWLQEMKTCKTPTVLYDNYVPGNPCVAHVGVDSNEAMNQAVGHLISLGHRKIGYLSSALSSYIYRQRYRSFLQALGDQGLPQDRSLTGAADLISDCLLQHLPRLLHSGCTAIICSHDILANALLTHCREIGIAIPQELSILGFDDIPLCCCTAPALSTIRQDRVLLGKSAFYALSSLLNQIPIGTLLLHPQLIVRDSTAPAFRHLSS